MRDTRRGARIDKRKDRNNDGLVALLMAVDRAEQKPKPVKFLGFV
jgi:hypothetical protein